ncbi:MAG: mechanosensitive ion channel family protein [Ktedonobacterales bacterium]
MNYLILLGQIKSSLPLGISDPSPLIRLSLSIVVIGMAVFGGGWLAGLANRVPAYPWRLSRSSKVEPESNNGFGHLLGRITLISVGLLATVVILLIWFSDGKTLAKAISPQALGDFLTALALRIIGSLLVFVCMLGFGRLFQRMIEGRLISGHISRNVVLLAGRTVYIASLVVGVIIILALWGTGIVVPVAVGGALTVALTLSLQDVLRNLVSGVYLLLEHPFVIGDRIALQPYSGQIEDIQLRYTALRTEDNQRVLIPNSMLFTGAVVNLSAYDTGRVVLLITLPEKSGDRLEGVEEQIRGVLFSVAGIRPEPSPQIMINGTSAGKMQLQVMFWMPTGDQDTATALTSQAISRLSDAFPDAEVTRAGSAAAPTP